MTQHRTSPAFAANEHRAWYSEIGDRIPANILVASGVAMFVLYIAMDLIASLSYDGYSYTDQTISELSAIGAPTRGMWNAFSVVYQVLTFAFAFGVLRVAGQRRIIRVIGWLLLTFAAINLLWWFGPMHRREELAAGGGDWRDTLHLVVGGMNSLLFFALIGVGMFAFGRWFLWYSIATIAAMVIFGTLMNTDVGGDPRQRADAVARHLGTDRRRGRDVVAGRVRRGVAVGYPPANDRGAQLRDPRQRVSAQGELRWNGILVYGGLASSCSCQPCSL